jgi:hypothetical protein
MGPIAPHLVLRRREAASKDDSSQQNPSLAGSSFETPVSGLLRMRFRSL